MNNKDLQTICFVFNEEQLEYDDETLSDCNETWIYIAIC